MILTRRGLVLWVAASGVACSKAIAAPVRCDDAALSDDDRALRATMGYAERAPDPARGCEHCVQWTPPSGSDGCGGCKLLKGRIHPAGTCKAFSPRA